MGKIYKGEVKGRIVDARFAISGKIVSVGKHTGDIVKKGGLIASLDRKILQAELDRQLADFEKIRADFDGFAMKYPGPKDDNKYTKAEKQAALNAGVKDVELAKAKLDQADLFSPVDGIILDDSGITPGLFVTPAGGSIRIVDCSSYFFEIELEQKDISDFSEAKKCNLEIISLKEKITAESKPVFSDGKKFLVRIPISNPSILLGMKGKVSI